MTTIWHCVKMVAMSHFSGNKDIDLQSSLVQFFLRAICVNRIVFDHIYHVGIKRFAPFPQNAHKRRKWESKIIIWLQYRSGGESLNQHKVIRE